MTSEDKFKLITRNLEETLTEGELKSLIQSGTPLKHYIGFEISGKLHLGHLFTMMKIKDMQDAGAETVIWLADLHSAINDKLDGNLETIKRIARGYFIDTFKTLLKSIGGNPDKLIFKLCSETYAEHPDFWLTFLEIGKDTTLARIMRSITIMGREQSQDLESSKLMYPLMQAADIFLLGANIAHAGIDQRKVHIIAREAANKIRTYALKNKKGEQIKPVAIHHPILLGLTAPELGIKGADIDEIAMRSKMSKSKPGSGISIHDSEEEIKKKINDAYAPEGQIENNPILNWTRYLVFYNESNEFYINRPEKWGGKLIYTSYKALEKDYSEKKLHPQDLKISLAQWLTNKLEPVREHFETSTEARILREVEMLTTKQKGQVYARSTSNVE